MLQRSALIVRQVGTDVDVCSKEAAGQSKQSGASLDFSIAANAQEPGIKLP